MLLQIVNHTFESDDILSIIIREELRTVFVQTREDFVKLRYRKEADIEDVKIWQRLHNITYKEIEEAISTLFIICDYHINTKEQCKGCPMYKKFKCIFSDIPSNWRD